MSTRSNIKLTDRNDTLWFYRHNDSYPSGALPTLRKFMDLLRTGKIRNNSNHAGGWLIALGRDEYLADNTIPANASKDHIMGWKVGAIEPTTCQHGDIEYLYHIKLDTKELLIFRVDDDKLIPIDENGKEKKAALRDERGRFKKKTVKVLASFEYRGAKDIGYTDRHVEVVKRDSNGIWAAYLPGCEKKGFRYFLNKRMRFFTETIA